MLLICPACRHVDDAGLQLCTLDLHGQARVCSGCGATSPVLDGICVIGRDPEVLIAYADRPENLDTVAVYQRSSRGPLQDWLRETVPSGALELGGGLGVRADAVLLDQNLGMLRASSHALRVCADLLDPPFAPESFGAVVLANVLDSVGDPLLAFQQAIGLLEPGGVLIVSCAFAFRAEITPEERWFTSEQLACGFGAVEAGCLRVEDKLELEWPLRVSERLVHLHRCDALVFRKL